MCLVGWERWGEFKKQTPRERMLKSKNNNRWKSGKTITDDDDDDDDGDDDDENHDTNIINQEKQMLRIAVNFWVNMFRDISHITFAQSVTSRHGLWSFRPVLRYSCAHICWEAPPPKIPVASAGLGWDPPLVLRGPPLMGPTVSEKRSIPKYICIKCTCMQTCGKFWCRKTLLHPCKHVSCTSWNSNMLWLQDFRKRFLHFVSSIPGSPDEKKHQPLKNTHNNMFSMENFVCESKRTHPFHQKGKLKPSIWPWRLAVQGALVLSIDFSELLGWKIVWEKKRAWIFQQVSHTHGYTCCLKKKETHHKQ